MTRNFIDHLATRRIFLGGTTALVGCAILPRSVLGTPGEEPNSVSSGV